MEGAISSLGRYSVGLPFKAAFFRLGGSDFEGRLKGAKLLSLLEEVSLYLHSLVGKGLEPEDHLWSHVAG